MPADKYAFEEVDTDELAAAVQKLRSSQKSKDVLAKGLKELADVLQKFPQDVQALGSTAKQLVVALAQKAVLQHTDKDVKLYAANCFAQLLRIYAPDVPYEDKRTQLVSSRTSTSRTPHASD
jgi:sister-chromatid-cohesion protein PDS5